MMEIAIFAAKVLIIVLGISIVIVVIALAALKAKHTNHLEVDPLHKKRKNTELLLKTLTASKKELKEEKKKQKQLAKKNAQTPTEKRVFVIRFNGDVKAHQSESLREEVSAVLSTATDKDEVVVTIESPGGVVHGYGLCASQLLRIRDKGIYLTVCVDKVAASGGYLMAVVANQIIAAPFAIIGSIGVIAQVPNFYRILKKNDIDYKEYTAGDFKRTVSLLGEITEKGEAKFIEQLEQTHKLFKAFVSKFRPQLDLSRVATGEYWFGEDAKNLQLIDTIKTSDEYLLSFSEDTPIFEVKYEQKQTLADKISGVLGRSAEKALNKIAKESIESRFL